MIITANSNMNFDRIRVTHNEELEI